MSEAQERQAVQPAAHHAYGSVIYVLSLVATGFCILGPFLAIAWPRGNCLAPQGLFFRIWQGAGPDTVWGELPGGFPGAHFWLENLTRGDGIVQLGLVIGCVSAAPAFLAAAAAYLRRGRREPFWALLCLVCAALVTAAMLGLVRLAE
ncbi:MAG: hypothetical protein JXR77_17335 [Lentisphaeria bacterium]|nr:hypothetical protein [Lentisphaeria bacterium]